MPSYVANTAAEQTPLVVVERALQALVSAVASRRFHAAEPTVRPATNAASHR